MRCTDLATTWQELQGWFDGAGVLVLPAFRGGQLVVQLDDDLDQRRTATAAEASRVLARLRDVVGHFGVPAVYVRQARWSADDEWALGEDSHAGLAAPPTRILIRVLAGGIVHELVLVADWYAELEEAPTTRLYASIP